MSILFLSVCFYNGKHPLIRGSEKAERGFGLSLAQAL